MFTNSGSTLASAVDGTGGLTADHSPSESERNVARAEAYDGIGLEEKLLRCEAELVQLRTENDQLRRSSQAFGELAERLNIALKTASRVTGLGSAAVQVRTRGRSES